MEHEDTSRLDPQLVQALSSLHYGLYFLSAGSREQPRGMLVSWVSQVSGDPPLVMVAVRHNRATLEVLQEQQAFALNLLPSGDREMVGNLARRGAARLQGVALEQGPGGLPVLVGGRGVICCRVVETFQPGDHVLLVGQAEKALWRSDGQVYTAAEAGHAYLGLR